MDLALLVHVAARQPKRILSLESHRSPPRTENKTACSVPHEQAASYRTLAASISDQASYSLILNVIFSTYSSTLKRLIFSEFASESSSENFLKPTLLERDLAELVLHVRVEERRCGPSSRAPRCGSRRRTTSSPPAPTDRGRPCEIASLISGTVTFAGCLVGSRKIPIWSAATEHFHVNESTRRHAVARQVADLDAEVRAQPRLLLRADLAADVLAAALRPANLLGARTRCRSTPRPCSNRRAWERSRR